MDYIGMHIANDCSALHARGGPRRCLNPMDLWSFTNSLSSLTIDHLRCSSVTICCSLSFQLEICLFHRVTCGRPPATGSSAETSLARWIMSSSRMTCRIWWGDIWKKLSAGGILTLRQKHRWRASSSGRESSILTCLLLACLLWTRATPKVMVGRRTRALQHLIFLQRILTWPSQVKQYRRARSPARPAPHGTWNESRPA